MANMDHHELPQPELNFYHWPFMTGIQRWPVDSSHKGPIILDKLWDFVACTLEKIDRVITHQGQMRHSCVSKFGHDWYRYRPVACSAPSHYLNQWGHTVILENRFQWNWNQDSKRKPPCIGGMELVSLSCNRVFISAESVGRGWCKIAIATKWYQFHTTDKCGFLFMPWITDQYTFMQYTKLVNKYAPL